MVWNFKGWWYSPNGGKLREIFMAVYELDLPPHPGCQLGLQSFSLGFPTTPWKIKMEPQNGGLEDDVPFLKLWFLGYPFVNFRGVQM